MWGKAIIASLAWFIVFYKFSAMRRDNRWRTGSVTFYYWVFSLCFAIGLTFMIVPVYTAFDHFIGLPNFGWLISYASITLAVYFSGAACYLILKQRRPRIVSWSVLVTLTALITIYSIGIVTLPEKPDHTIPELLPEAIFMGTLYIYAAVFCIIPIVTFTRLFLDEQVVSARLRWLVAASLSFAAAFALTMKIVLTMFVFRDSDSSALVMLSPAISVSIGLVGILFPISFLPNEWYQIMARPFEFTGKAISLHRLKALQARLNTLCPPVIEKKMSVRESFNDLDFHLYRTVIAILDAKQTLIGYANVTDELTTQPSIMMYKADGAQLVWDKSKLQQARLLHRELQKADDEADFAQIVQAYRKISRAVAWEMRSYPDYTGDLVDLAY